jgi:hypothetical protein
VSREGYSVPISDVAAPAQSQGEEASPCREDWVAVSCKALCDGSCSRSSSAAIAHTCSAYSQSLESSSLVLGALRSLILH